jgi:Periplasmic copper-binding protein (NosD)
MKKSMHRIGTPAVRLASVAHWRAKLGLAVWFSALAFGAQMSSASVTYIVGTCKSGTQFSTIQSALDASPAPNTVEVCPGVYSEQVTITKPVSLEGITASNGGRVRIVLPAGYTANATLAEVGRDNIPAVAQVYVNNVSGGSVNLTNLDVDGSGFSMDDIYFVGIVYQGSSGTINRVITGYQNNSNPGQTDVEGFGMWIQGGSSKPSVTVENSSMHDFGSIGIDTTGIAEGTSDLTVTIKNNAASSTSTNTWGIYLDEGSNPTVSGNVVSGVEEGIYAGTLQGSITGNTIVGTEYGIELNVDGASVKSNNIFESTSYGMYVERDIQTSQVQDNIIRTVAPGGGGIGISLGCDLKISPGKINLNTIMDSDTGYGYAPAGFAGSNTYAGVYTPIATCTSESASARGSAPARLKLLGRSRKQ